MANRKSAKVLCRNACFWITPKQFWQWVREGIIKYKSEAPLTGEYLGEKNDFLVKIGNIVLDSACPEHLREVYHATRQQRKSAGRG